MRRSTILSVTALCIAIAAVAIVVRPRSVSAPQSVSRDAAATNLMLAATPFPVVTAVASQPVTVTFDVSALSTLGGATSWGYDIDDRGRVVGQSETSGG